MTAKGVSCGRCYPATPNRWLAFYPSGRIVPTEGLLRLPLLKTFPGKILGVTVMPDDDHATLLDPRAVVMCEECQAVHYEPRAVIALGYYMDTGLETWLQQHPEWPGHALDGGALDHLRGWLRKEMEVAG